MPRVLVVDDAMTDRVLVQGLLENEDYEVEAVENGALALQLVSQDESQFDMVVTDLCMPEMDGLQLVTSLHLQHPSIPVILITANGSEDLAMAALQQGAASYVPKKHLAQKLVETVEHVIMMRETEQNYADLSRCMESALLRFQLSGDQQLHEHFVELIRQMVGSSEFVPAAEEIRLGMALEEALKLMTLMGNLELSSDEMRSYELSDPAMLDVVEQRRHASPYAERSLRVIANLSRDACRFEISHQGPGFDIESLPQWDEPEALEEVDCRSVVLLHSFLDAVQFDQQGRLLTLIKQS